MIQLAISNKQVKADIRSFKVILSNSITKDKSENEAKSL